MKGAEIAAANRPQRPCDRRILLVDRDRHLHLLATDLLQSGGHHVISAYDGHEALQVMKSIRPGLLITEILLPKMDGLALCRAVKAEPTLAHARVLVFSILAAKNRAKEAGADGFLTKPLVRSRLNAAIALLIQA